MALADSPIRVRIHPWHVIREAARLGRRRFAYLALTGLAVFVPIGLIESLDVNVVDVSWSGILVVGAALATFTAFAAVTLIGEVLYSGIVAAAVREVYEGRPHPLGRLLRSLPYGRLIAADILFVLLAAAGFLALLVPGLIFVCWFSLTAPVIEVERIRLRAAFRRSRDLVRLDFWRAGAIILGAWVIADGLTEGIAKLIGALLGHSFAASWAESAISEVITAPLFALPIVVLYFELAGLATSSGTETKR